MGDERFFIVTDIATTAVPEILNFLNGVDKERLNLFFEGSRLS